MLGISGNYSCLTFRGPRASALAPVHAAAALVFNSRVLTGRAFTCFGEAALTWPVGADKPMVTTVTINFTVNFARHLTGSMARPKDHLRAYWGLEIPFGRFDKSNIL